jgi:hypothetical protein
MVSHINLFDITISTRSVFFKFRFWGVWGGGGGCNLAATLLGCALARYNNIGLYDISSITTDIVWYQLISHCEVMGFWTFSGVRRIK